MWVHGDLHPANVVVSDGTLSGVVDFGDMFAGDPAWDLAAAWVLLPAGTASRFFDMYAQADEADDPARPRAGRYEEPLPDAHGAERRSGPSRRQADTGDPQAGRHLIVF